LQVGLEQSEVIMLIMTQKGLEGVLHDQFKIGAQAGISIVTLGSGVEGGVGGASLPDVVVCMVDRIVWRPYGRRLGHQGGAEPGRGILWAACDSLDALFGNVPNPQAAVLRRQIDGNG